MEKSQLAVIGDLTNPLDVYVDDNLNIIISKLEIELTSIVPDLSTAKGRKEVASRAYKVSQSKTILDGLGIDLNAERKKLSKAVDKRSKER